MGTAAAASVVTVLVVRSAFRRRHALLTSLELRDGHRIPAVGFGTFTIPDADAERCTALALGAGYKHIDTAEFYQNEAGVGRAIAASGIARESGERRGFSSGGERPQL